AVYIAAGDNDVSATIQRLCDGKSPEIGVDTRDLLDRWKGFAREHLPHGAEFLGVRDQVVALDHGDPQVESRRLHSGAHGLAAGARVHAAGVGENLYALSRDLLEVRPEQGDEVAGVALRRIPGALARHDRHGDLGQIVEDDVVEIAGLQELRQRHVV